MDLVYFLLLIAPFSFALIPYKKKNKHFLWQHSDAILKEWVNFRKNVSLRLMEVCVSRWWNWEKQPIQRYPNAKVYHYLQTNCCAGVWVFLEDAFGGGKQLLTCNESCMEITFYHYHQECTFVHQDPVIPLKLSDFTPWLFEHKEFNALFYFEHIYVAWFAKRCWRVKLKFSKYFTGELKYNENFLHSNRLYRFRVYKLIFRIAYNCTCCTWLIMI